MDGDRDQEFTRQDSFKRLQNSRLISVEDRFKFGTGTQEKS